MDSPQLALRKETKMSRKRIETYTLSLALASSETYMNHVTVEWCANGTIMRKTNEGGNGQSWALFGYVSLNGTYKLFQTNESEIRAARIMAHCAAGCSNASGFGAAHSNAVALPRLGRLTHPESIREGFCKRPRNDLQEKAESQQETRRAEMAKRWGAL